MWLKEEPDRKDFANEETGTINQTEYRAAVEEWKKRRPLPPPGITTGGQQPQQGGQQPSASTQSPNTSTDIQAVSPDRSEGQRQWASLQVGAIVRLPNGLTVRKTGPTTYEIIQQQ